MGSYLFFQIKEWYCDNECFDVQSSNSLRMPKENT